MAITKASDSPYRELTFISTGFPKLDKIIGGGIATRKISELSGKFSVGKSTLAYSIIKNAQSLGMDCLYADTEFSWSEDYAASLGVDIKSLDLSQEKYAEETLEAVEGWAKSHKDALVVLDSIGGLLPREEAEKEAGAKVIGGQAKLVAAFARKIVPVLAANNVALVVLNHVFLDVMSGNLMTSGGWKLGYHKSLEIRLSKTKNLLKQGEQVVGRQIEAKIIKNKLSGTQDQSATLNLLYGQGFSVEADLLEEAMDKGVITRKGPNYHFRSEKFFGVNKIREALKGDLAAQVKDALLQIPHQPI
jgi:recombination protein RecA